jgi:hypothetical protein
VGGSPLYSALFGIFQAHIHPLNYFSHGYKAHVVKGAISYYEVKKLYMIFPHPPGFPFSDHLFKVTFEDIFRCSKATLS